MRPAGGVGPTDEVTLAGRTAPSRVLFGPHVTNLARGRSISEGHVAYYARRAVGGAGLVVTEVASVHDSDRPYERAPRAADCASGWAAVGEACRPHGTRVLAGLGHAGSQGSSAWHRGVLWAPSALPDVVTREVPVAMTSSQVGALVAGFASAAALAVASGLDGVEIQAGQHALLRQFLSGLTNTRGPDASVLLDVLAAVRAAVGPGVIVGLRLCVDELAPWAGITLDDGIATAVRAAPWVDYLVPVRGSGLSVAATSPDGHTAPSFLAPACAAVRAAVDGATAVVLAGSVVEPAAASEALASGVADVVEMTRAQIADPSLVAAVRAGRAPRPCVLTNQECRVRDVRNPLVSCTVSPAGVLGPGPVDVVAAGGPRRDVLVVGGGPAGLEAARTLALDGRRVRLHERSDVLGGAIRTAARMPGRERFAVFADWLVAEVLALGVEVRPGVEVTAAEVDAADAVVVATGAVDRVPSWAAPGSWGAQAPPAVVPVARYAAGEQLPAGPVVVDDPIGDGVGVAAAEMLAAAGRTVALVTGDPVAGKLLARTGDLVDANGRLQRAGVTRLLSSRLVEVRDGAVAVVADVDTGARREVPCAVVVDASARLPSPPLGADRPGLVRVGDAVAPRTVAEAVREGRRAAAELGVPVRT